MQIGPAAGLGGEPVDISEISFLKIRMLIQNLLFAHTGAQPSENIPHRDPEAANARLASAFFWLNRDPASEGGVHKADYR